MPPADKLVRNCFDKSFGTDHPAAVVVALRLRIARHKLVCMQADTVPKSERSIVLVLAAVVVVLQAVVVAVIADCRLADKSADRLRSTDRHLQLKINSRIRQLLYRS
jgi:hypothetical protein